MARMMVIIVHPFLQNNKESDTMDEIEEKCFCCHKDLKGKSTYTYVRAAMPEAKVWKEYGVVGNTITVCKKCSDAWRKRCKDSNTYRDNMKLLFEKAGLRPVA